MIELLLGFCLGVFVAPWVREPLAKLVARGVRAIGGVRPVADNKPIEPEQPEIAALAEMLGAPGKTIRRDHVSFSTATKNITEFFGGVLGFMSRNPVLCIGLALLAFWLIFGRACSPFENLTKSRDLVEYEGRLAEERAQLAEKLGLESARIIDDFHRTVDDIDQALAQGDDELENLRHAETLVFLRAHAAADRSLCNAAGGCGDSGA